MRWFTLCFLCAILSLTSLYACPCNCNCQNEKEYSQDNLDELYSDLCDASQTDMIKALNLYKTARNLDPHFPAIEEIEDGSFVVKNLRPEDVNDYFKDKYTRDMLKFGICESKEDIQFLEDGIHVTPVTCKKKVL